MKPRIAAVITALVVLTTAGFVDAVARRAYATELRAEFTTEVEHAAHLLGSVVDRESMVVASIAAFVRIGADNPGRLDSEFTNMAESLMGGHS